MFYSNHGNKTSHDGHKMTRACVQDLKKSFKKEPPRTMIITPQFFFTDTLAIFQMQLYKLQYKLKICLINTKV
jgi:hypothetical protein